VLVFLVVEMRELERDGLGPHPHVLVDQREAELAVVDRAGGGVDGSHRGGDPTAERRERTGGKVNVRASAPTGRMASTYSVASSPHVSATTPGSGAPSPPRPIERPSVTPDAVPSLPGRYSCPITTVTLKVAITAAPMKKSSTVDAGGLSAW